MRLSNSEMGNHLITRGTINKLALVNLTKQKFSNNNFIHLIKNQFPLCIYSPIKSQLHFIRNHNLYILPNQHLKSMLYSCLNTEYDIKYLRQYQREGRKEERKEGKKERKKEMKDGRKNI